MSDILDTQTQWLSEQELATARGQLPIVYVDAVPVRTGANGEVTAVGLLLRAMPDGSISRAVVSGRVMFGERIKDALIRHLEKTLGRWPCRRYRPRRNLLRSWSTFRIQR